MARKNKKFKKIDEQDLASVGGGCRPGGCYTRTVVTLKGARAGMPGLGTAPGLGGPRVAGTGAGDDPGGYGRGASVARAIDWVGSEGACGAARHAPVCNLTNAKKG